MKGIKAKAWRLCSEYIRRKYADRDGYVRCVSCGTSIHWKEADAGHFIPKARGAAVYFLEENIHPQCRGCNRFNVEMAKIGYVKYMLDYYGRDMIEYLEAESRKIKRWRKGELEAIAEDYKRKLGEL